MAENLDILADKMIQSLKDRFEEANLNDTGKAMDSLSYIVGENSIVIEGLARILFLEFGRRPSSDHDNWKELMPFILPWVRRKLNVEESGVYPVAVTISKKIAKNGTQILADKAKGLQIEITLSKVFDEMSEIVAENELLEITNGLIKAWKE